MALDYRPEGRETSRDVRRRCSELYAEMREPIAQRSRIDARK
jgi:hypothetical protein